MTSFAGGGFTGYGPRSGGVDGMGGFNAILHRNETVIDHPKPGAARSPIVNINISGARGNAEIRDMVVAGLGEYDRRLPGRVAQIRMDPGLRG